MNKKQSTGCYHVKLHGTTTVGTKGQIVIPASVRKELDIKQGDQLLVMVKLGKAIALVKANELDELHKAIEKELDEIRNMDNVYKTLGEEVQQIKNSHDG